jgi:lipoprotein NlpI
MISILRYGFSLSIILAWTFSGMVHAENKKDTPQETQKQQLEQYLATLNDLVGDEPSRIHHRRAEVFFRLGRFKEAIADYDKGIEFGLPHDKDSCWERGLAQYYAGDYRGGAEQFFRYHQVGVLDIENGLWRLMCIEKDEGLENARASMLTYSDKKRPPFPALLDLFLDKGDVTSVVQEATEEAKSTDQRTTNLFYAHYYIGKYFEMIDDKEKSLQHFQTALTHKVPHFMYACAEEDFRRIKRALTKITQP